MVNLTENVSVSAVGYRAGERGGGCLLPYMGYIGTCRCKWYVFSKFTLQGIIINERFWV